jgi:hypothetical protein
MEEKQWWEHAACAGCDPEWWADDRAMRATAVEICLDCPVREPCGREALKTGGMGVVRAGLLLTRQRGRMQAVSLVCAHCHRRPVQMTKTGQGLYCGRRCAASAQPWSADDAPGQTSTGSTRRRKVRVPRPHRQQAAIIRPALGDAT